MSRAPILSAYREAGFIDTFPLHDDEALRKLDATWRKSNVFFPPVEEIHVQMPTMSSSTSGSVVPKPHFRTDAAKPRRRVTDV